MARASAPHTVVMGAGVIGITSAYYLAKDGHRVTVIDRQPGAAAETSYANAGLIAPGHALTWSSPRAPRILWKSLFQEGQALRLNLPAHPPICPPSLPSLNNST